MQQIRGALSGLAGGTLALELKLTVLATLLGIEAGDLIGALQKGQITSIAGLPRFLESQLEKAVQDGEEQLGKPLWELLIRAPAGLNAAAIESGQAGQAVHMVQRMLGFGLALPLITARLEAVLKGILGDHAPDGLLESIRRLPEEIGVNFFIGTVLERIFETAVATPLEEAIAEQTRPARFDWRVVKLLLTKHHITPEIARSYLERIGYRNEDIDRVLELGEQFLSVGDVQQLFLSGEFSEADAHAYFLTLGYTDEDAGRLVTTYLHKAETAGAQQLRATARGGYLDGKITEAEYRELLASVNTPKRSIELEIESANLHIQWGRRQLSVANLKTLHQSGHLNDRQAVQQLGQLGFTEDDSLALLETWSIEKRTTHAALSVQRILAYQLGGVITPSESLQLLLSTGLKVEDASLLVKHPGHMGGVYAHELSPSTVLSALKEGVIEVEAARHKLEQLSVDPEEIELSLSAAVAKLVRGSKPKAPHRALTEGQILEAFKLGLANDAWALQELSLHGYTEADAAIILAIETAKLTGKAPPGWATLT